MNPQHETPMRHSDEAIVAAHDALYPSLMSRSHGAGLDYHTAQDLVQSSMVAVISHRDTIDGDRDSLERYALTSYANRRADIYRSAWNKHVSIFGSNEFYEDHSPFDKKAHPSAEEDYFTHLRTETAIGFFAVLLDPENALLSDEQRDLLAAYLSVENWRKACEATGSSADHNAAKSRGRRLLKKIADLVQQGEIESPL